MTRKKLAITVVIVAVLVAAGGAYGIYHLQITSNSATSIRSNHQRIVLQGLTAEADLRDGTQIAGTYKAEADQALMYSVSKDNKELVASGVVMPDEKGNFSRNVAFASKPEDGSKLTLKIFAQNKKGETVDELSLPVTYRQ